MAAVGVMAPGAQSASALAPGSFLPTGSMTVSRSFGAAAPLPDGRVLVAGGTADGGGTVLQSAEIFDPATGAFSPTGAMTVAREGAAAAPLPDGRVLVAGGGNGSGTLQSAEIFDPATGSFAPTGAMTVAREGAAAAPLPDGRVLVAGGAYLRNVCYDSCFEFLQSAEIFDPATGSFAPTGSMTDLRAGAAAAPLPDGRVLIAGGGSAHGALALPSAEIFDPAAGTFAPTGSMFNHRRGAAAAPLPDGRVLVAGGGDPHAEIFDPATGSFSLTGSLTVPRGGPAAAPLPDGRVLVAGGSFSQSAELFTPGLFHKLRGTKLTATVAVAGTLAAVDAKARRGSVAAAARKKRRPSLKPTSASGGPGPITLKLRPTTRAKRTLERKGKLKVRVRLSFAPAPVRGGCVTLTGPCYSSDYAITETATLTLKAKRGR